MIPLSFATPSAVRYCRPGPVCHKS
jgi:hypothetical protein